MVQNADEFFSSIPQMTKYICGFSFGLTLMSSLKIVNAYSFLLFPAFVFSSKLQLWRLLTSLVYLGSFSLNYVFNFLFLLNFMQNLEKDHYENRKGDFVFLLLFGFFFLIIIGIFMGLPLLSYAFMSYIVYIWCNLNPTRDVALFLIPIQVKAIYFPWALLALHSLMGASPLDDIIGILVGHLFYFLDVKYPETSGKRFLKTPEFLIKMFPNSQINIHGYNLRNQGVPQQQQNNNFGGQGRRLGGN